MTDTPRKNRKSWWLYCLVIASPFLAVIIFAICRVYSVVALQSATINARSVWVGNADALRTELGWDEKMIEYLKAKAEDHGVEFSAISQVRMRALLLSKIDAIGITDPKRIGPELGSALARFPKLRHFSFVNVTRGSLSERDITTLLTQMRRMERLDTMLVYSIHLTDASLSTLAGHPALNKLDIGMGSITPDVVGTLKSMPELKEVTIHPEFQSDEIWRLCTTQQAFADALPGVKVVFRTR